MTHSVIKGWKNYNDSGGTMVRLHTKIGLVLNKSKPEQIKTETAPTQTQISTENQQEKHHLPVQFEWGTKGYLIIYNAMPHKPMSKMIHMMLSWTGSL